MLQQKPKEVRTYPAASVTRITAGRWISKTRVLNAIRVKLNQAKKRQCRTARCATLHTRSAPTHRKFPPARRAIPQGSDRIRWIEFDNKFGGLITIRLLESDETVTIGQVYQPAFGVGRFEGSLFLKPGRIRANHPGVICISTSPLGEIGGFQIIPLEHAMSPEMKFARTLTQWMVVGPIDPRSSQEWEGLVPLFSDNIYPSFVPVSDNRFTALDTLMSRFQVIVKMKGSDEWKLMPAISGRDDEALLNVERMRILFPLD